MLQTGSCPTSPVGATCVCTCTYTCMCMHMCIYMHVYAHVHIHACVCICAYTCMCMHMCIYMHVFARVYTCAYTCMCSHVYTHVHIHACVYSPHRQKSQVLAILQEEVGQQTGGCTCSHEILGPSPSSATVRHALECGHTHTHGCNMNMLETCYKRIMNVLSICYE